MLVMWYRSVVISTVVVMLYSLVFARNWKLAFGQSVGLIYEVE
jgi:hypothetical protein